MDVIVDQDAQAILTVDDGQEQQQPVIRPPAQGLPAQGDELVIDDVDVVDDVDDQQVAKGQHEQEHARNSEEVPAPQLKGAASWPRHPPLVRCTGCAAQTHRASPIVGKNTGRSMKKAAGRNSTRNAAQTTYHNWRWMRVAFSTKSITMIRRPLMPW